MVGRDEDRQYLTARESDMWLGEAERVQTELADLDPAAEDTPDVLKKRAWLEYVLARQDDVTQELLKLQGLLTEDDVVDIGDND
jgi:hypothetical protein